MIILYDLLADKDNREIIKNHLSNFLIIRIDIKKARMTEQCFEMPYQSYG